MFKTTSSMAVLTVCGMIAFGAAAPATACEDNYIGTRTRGYQNNVTMETWGDHYVSVDQSGDRNGAHGRLQGCGNGLVIGQARQCGRHAAERG
jgi:hypothetical protein